MRKPISGAKPSGWKANQRKLAPWLFLTPGVLMFMVYVIMPIFQSMWISFYDWDGLGAKTWIGIANYVELIDDEAHAQMRLLHASAQKLLVVGAYLAELRQALAAIAAGKHVHCEKPLAPSADDARVMMEAAEKAGVRTQVGYNYIKNPILKLARDMVVSGELGDIIGFRGIHAEDYMVDPTGPWNWRVDPRGGGGAVA